MKKIFLVLSTSLCSQAFAAGFYNDLQSTSAMGNAFAGAGAAGDDASIMFYNPAGLTLFDEGQFVISGIYAAPNTDLTVDSTADSFGNPNPNSVGQEYSATPDQVSPAVYAAAPLADGIVLGMSITSPYEVETDYSDTAVDNTARQTHYIAYTGNLSLAMEITEQLSVGVGANLQYFKVKMNASPEGTNNQNQETINAFTEYTGDDIAFYPNFGLLYEFTKNTRVGLNYRMYVDHETNGDFVSEGTVTGPSSVPATIDFTSPASALFLLPDMASINLFHRPTERIELLADVMFTRWSRFQDVIVTVEDPIGGTTEPVNTNVSFEDTWRAGLGANYYFTPEIKLRTGVAYDQSPVTDETRTLQGPDSDRVDAAIGLMYKPKSWGKTHIDVAYMHTFFQDATVSQTNPIINLPFFPPGSGTDGITATGSFNTSADFLGIQLVHLM